MSPEPSPSTAANSRSEIEILLVEDDPDELELTLHALRAENLSNRVLVARDGEEALDLLFGPDAADRPLPRLILLDLKLPKVDGLEVLRVIKNDERGRFVPVVALTSSREERDLIESYKVGVNSFIQKPVDFEQFRAIVKHIGMYWLLVNQPPLPVLNPRKVPV